MIIRMNRQSTRQQQQRKCLSSLLTTIITCIITTIIICTKSNSNIRTVTAYSYNSYPYLYTNQDTTNKQTDESGNIQTDSSYDPIQEHIPIKVNDNNDRPDFIYNPPPGEYRIIEYYVHWCNICRHFNKHYVKYARKIQQLLADQKQQQDNNIRISFHAISCVPNKALCRKQNIPGYPMVQLLKPGETFGTLLKHSEVKPVAMLQALGIDTSGMKEMDDETKNNDDDATPNTIDRSVGQVIQHRRTRDDLRNDIHLSFDFAMRNNVYTRDNPLTEEEKRALKAYLDLMKQTIPSSWTLLHALLENLIRNYRYASKKEPYLLKILDKHPPQNYNSDGDPEWSMSCTKGKQGQGFTCGLWETFHTMSVGLVNYNYNQVDDHELVAPETGARIIRDFVQYFLHCTECTDNFIKMYDTCAYKRCQRLTKTTKLTGDKKAELEWREFSLWLYEVHNGVNVRLLKERAQREKLSELTVQDIVNVQWPPVDDCPICWYKPDRRGKRLWNETAVFKYMQLEYGKRDETILEFHKYLQSIKTDPKWKPNSKMLRAREGIQHQSPNMILTSSFIHPFILLLCAIVYVSLGNTGRAMWYTILPLGRRKLRTN